jgi:hypothetical protein
MSVSSIAFLSGGAAAARFSYLFAPASYLLISFGKLTPCSMGSLEQKNGANGT